MVRQRQDASFCLTGRLRARLRGVRGRAWKTSLRPSQCTLAAVHLQSAARIPSRRFGASVRAFFRAALQIVFGILFRILVHAFFSAFSHAVFATAFDAVFDAVSFAVFVAVF